MNNNGNKCFTEENLYNYIENQLIESKMTQVENHLKECMSCFNVYTELKELIYLQKKSPPISISLMERLKNLPNTLRKKKKSKIDITIQFSHDVIKVLSYRGWTKQETLNLAFATRDGEIDESKDKIVLTRKINDHEVNIALFRKEKDTFQLMVSLFKGKRAEKEGTIHLLKEEIELEFIELSSQTTFNYHIRVGIYTIKFKKKEKMLFEFSLIIEGENENPT